MPVGLEIYDRAGNTVLSLDDRIGRVLGSVRTNGVAGSLRNSGFTTGTPFFCVQTTDRGGFSPTDVQISGEILSWNYPTPNELWPTLDAIIFYGVY